ncbi:MAG: SDR family NAD(P)-dependent oxidoreductase, partial [Pseudomonadota bacterium]
MGRLAGKRAFLTAAGQGIGAATARAFAAEGAEVIATDISAPLLEALAAETGAETTVLDARDTTAVSAEAERVGAVDILFNCAGYVHQGTVLE